MVFPSWRLMAETSLSLYKRRRKQLVAHPRSDHYQTEKTPSLSAIIFPFGLMISWPLVCSKKRSKKTGHGVGVGVGCEVDVRLVYEQSPRCLPLWLWSPSLHSLYLSTVGQCFQIALSDQLYLLNHQEKIIKTGYCLVFCILSQLL